MIRGILSVCAESIVRDAATNHVSVFNIIEEINTPTFPVAIQKLSSLFYLVKDEEDASVNELSIRFIINGEEINRFPIHSDFQNKLKTRVIVNLQGLVIPGPGRLHAILFLKDEEIGLWDIQINHTGIAKIQTTEG